ncbi:peptide ABC transporter substrate-binding protein [Brachyspira hyodysenteriae]|uniref:Extracellular solute-binding protein, family 5 n=1 Tax=Brachyspira hyodysenteriae (strain ATCC 49526 / WA1) TaxID=565034 RepID=A0A3B6VBT7_BRAHW|nr:peptide ABC transporter substrate-binding protein [Brachyspira hyodysenteriae]ACN83493.1 extracellular solute-binding protein, family 5 [Brachyspira hyodysenteriae WA1]KLI23885.1 peptide ABC transporter substrate-binding protein [Brachyspira hyodysenteriae]KLI40143.1 peptide ABC transporter substrate-binding protein [Brachyspira hyodysenteriae]KLI46606.1 peptide ABC transporter substrate-binding protein [Brachyspira hyodysenteriae]MCZ9885976.1 peptide ABC transporter substrate-binding prote
MKKIFILFMIFISFIISCSNNKSEDGISIFINTGPEPNTIDPSINVTSDAIFYLMHTFEGLLEKDMNGKLIPGVAESWEISEDGLTYTFKLRTNSKWTDGKTVVAGDFVYSWQRVVDPATGSQYGYQHEPVKNAKAITAGDMPKESLGIKAIDDYTLEVQLEAPTAYFLELLTFPTFYPLRKDIIEQYGDEWTLNADTYIGNGAFKLIERNRDESLVMVKNTNYWNIEDIVPDKITFVLMENETASVAGVKAGSLHFARSFPRQDIKTLQNEGLIVIKPRISSYYYCLNLTNEILKDVRVRRALSLAIDRNYIVEQITRGGEKPAGALVPFGISDYEGDFRENGGEYIDITKDGYVKNVEEAKKLMAEAGYPNGEGFPVMEFKADPGLHVKIFEAVQQMWKENLGIDVTLTQEEWAVFLQTRYDRNITMARGAWNGDFDDPVNFMALCLSYSPNNYSVYSNRAYDDMINEVMLSGDQKFRMQTMHKAEEMLMREEAIIPIYYYTEPLLVSPKLKDVYYDSLGFHKFHHCYLE